MKKLFLALVAVLFLYSPAFATNKTVVEQADKNTLDYGEYLNLIVGETKNSEWGFLLTHLNESSETRVYVGGKIYLNRMTYQPKENK